MLPGSRKAFYFIVTGILLVLVNTVIFSLFRERLNSKERYISQIRTKVLTALDVVKHDQEIVERKITGSGPSDTTDFQCITIYPYYVFRDDNLIYWSDYSVIPDYNNISDDLSFSYKEISGSSYIVLKKPVTKNSRQYEVVSLVNLYRKYEITNQYLKSGLNPVIFRHPQLTLFSSADKPDKVLAGDGTFLFSVEFYPGYKPESGFYEYLLFFLLILGLVFTIIGLIYQTIYFRYKGKYGSGLIFLIISLFTIRLIMVATEFPFNLVEIPVFDHRFYASSFFNASLGDLLLNLVMIFSIIGYLFTIYTKKSFLRSFLKAGKIKVFLVSVLLATINIILVLFIYLLVDSLARHSQWKFDITADLNYPVLKIFSFGLFFLAALIFLISAYIVNSIFFRIQGYRKLYIVLFQLLAGVLFSLITFINGFPCYIQAIITLGLVLFMATLDIRGIFQRLHYKTFVFILGSMIFCALSGSISIYMQVHHENEIERDRFAVQLLQERDVLTEYFIAEASRNITNDVFIQNRLFSPFASKDIIEQKIKKTYLNNYLDKFDVKVLLFNSQGLPINTNINYNDIKSKYALDRYQTEYDGLYYYQYERPVLSRRYLSFIPIKRYDQVAGYLIIDLKLKKIIRSTVYPRLLLDERFLSNYYEDIYNYALFNGDVLSYSAGEFNYQKDFNHSWLKNPILFSPGISKDEYRHQGYYGSKNKILVITWDTYPLSYFLANFSFNFLLQVAGFLILLIGYALYFQIKGREMNYLTKIQFYINLAFFMPLVIISIITISRIANDYELEEQSMFQEKAEATGGNIIPYLEQYIENRIGREELYNQVADVANLTESDISIFGIDIQRGRLIATSQPAVFEKKLISAYINPKAFWGITKSGNSSMILDENIGGLHYKSAYVAIKSSQTGTLLGILSVPFFSSQLSIERRIINLMVSVINTFTFVFIIFIFISYVISTNLVFPLKQMIFRIRKTTLTGNNQPIEYNSPDEIGQLVEAYNIMIIKLEQSRRALAQSEKEAGWREMAKQVAHEIKNPLTPMKLTLQHLKMRMESAASEEQNSFEKAIDSILHNIETLNGIADSFSNYAKMPVPVLGRFDLTGLLKQTAGLYMNNDDVKVTFNLPAEEIFIAGDEYWLGRAFSNLIINSIQAGDGIKKLVVDVEMKRKNDKVIIEVTDNGKGIPESIQDRIFMPNFSTKFTGSGIGLAVARRAVEHAGGKIWFESKEQVGTTFFIELPVET